MCSRDDKTINHIVNEFPKPAQKEHKRRHDWIRRRIYWEFFEKNGIHVKPKWYKHQPKLVIENDNPFGLYCTGRPFYNCRKT